EYGERIGDRTLLANAWRVVGALLLAYGQTEKGLGLTRAILPIVDQVADPRERHLLTVETAQALAWMGGEAEAMVPVLLDALKLGRELRVHDLCHSTGILINVLYLAGRSDEVAPYLEEHMRTFKSDDAGTTCPFAPG